MKALQRYLGFVNFNRSYIPRLADNTCCLQEIIKKDVPFKLNQQHKDAIFEINESLLKATKVSLKLQLIQFIRKVSLSRPVMSQVSPAEGIDLIESQKTNWVIQKMIRVLEGSEILQHPVNMQDQFFQKLHKP